MTCRQFSANTRLAGFDFNTDRMITRKMKTNQEISRLTLGEIGNRVSAITVDPTKVQNIKKEVQQHADKIFSRARVAKTRIPSSIIATSSNNNAGNRQVADSKAHSKVVTAEVDLAPTKMEVMPHHNVLPDVSRLIRNDVVVLDRLDHNVAPMDISGDLRDAFSKAMFVGDVEDIDAEDTTNPQLVSIYVNSIYCYMRQLEKKYSIRPNFLDGTDITGKMRSILIDWLCQVHNRFHLLHETFFLTVALIDRYLQVKPCKRSRLQLVGVAAMLVASKYEEMHAPEIADFVYITDNAYTKQDIRDMEQDILRTTDFSLGRPHCLHFLRRNSKAGQVSGTKHSLAKYVMELATVEYNMAHLLPSYVAAASLCLSMLVLSDLTWSSTLQFYSSYSEDELMPLVHSLAQLVISAETSKLTAVKTKHSTSKFMKIALIPQLRSETLLGLASQKVQTS